MQIYDPPGKPPAPKPKKIPGYVPIHTETPFMSPRRLASLGQYPYTPYQYVPNTSIPIINTYRMQTAGPSDRHGMVSRIYEDVLPKKDFTNSFNTVNERLATYHYLRSTVVHHNDGQSLSFNRDDSGILRYFKILELNPYSVNDSTHNPYAGLPDNFIIHRSCYPIRHDSGRTECAKNSTPVNIRTYRLSTDEYSSNKFIETSDVWREIGFYEYLRENIIKPRESPNFPLMFAWHVYHDHNINFEDFNRASIEAAGGTYVQKPYSDSGHALIVLTESPTYNILDWAKKMYRDGTTVLPMLQTGYHDEKTWLSVIFQLMAALYTMQQKNISITDFSLENNVWIKDTKVKEYATTYWEYVIDGITYYVPNHGYLVLIDSNFKNPSSGNKIYYGDKDYSNIIFDSFKNVFGSNKLQGSGAPTDYIPPPGKAMTLLHAISAELARSPEKNIGNYIKQFMSMFMNNRIGTLLKDGEIGNLRRGSGYNFKKGQLIAHETGYERYEFVTFVGKDSTNRQKAKVLKRVNKNGDIQEDSVHLSSLIDYPQNYPVKQVFKPNEAVISDEGLLETYKLSGKVVGA